MTYRVVIHRRAREEIAEAYRWIAERSARAADRWLDGVERAIRSLDQFPRRCGLAPEDGLAGLEVRQQIYGRRGGKYRILFVVRNDVVHVIHVRHGARQPLQLRDLEPPPAEADDAQR